MPGSIREVSVRQVMEEMGLSEKDFADRLAYLEISEEDSAPLRRAKPFLAELRDPLLDKLYDFLLEFEPLRARLGDKARVARVKRLLAEHFDAVAEGGTDLAHAESRLSAGLAHYRAGVEPQWFVGAARKHLSELILGLHGRMGGGPEFVTLVDALLKRFVLDTGIAIEAYFNEGHQALEEAHAYAAQVIATRTVGIAVINDQLKIDSVNRALCILFGVVPEDLMGLQLSDEVVPIAGLTRMVREVHEGAPTVNDWLVRSPSAGGMRSFEVSIARLPYHASERTLVTLTDVTDRIRTQDRCNRLGKVMESIDDMVLVVDRKSLRIVDASRRAETELGYARDELLDSGLDRVATGHGPLAEPFERLRADDPAPVPVPLLLKRKDGVELRVTARGSLVPGFGKAFVVLTARLQPEDHRIGDSLQSILEGLARGAPIAATLGQIVAAIEGAVSGLRCAIVAVDPHRPQVELVAAPGLGDAYTGRMQGLILGPESGTCGWALFAGREAFARDDADDPLWSGCPGPGTAEGIRACWSIPIIGRHENATGVLEAYAVEAREPCQDERIFLRRAAAVAAVAIQQWRLEREVAGAAMELESRIEQRTQELEHATRELEAYSYSLSHDLRAPLRAASGFARLLIEEHAATLPADARRYLDRIASATERTDSLISDMLRLFRLGRSEMRPERLDLTAMARSIAESIQEREPQRRVSWRIAPNLHVWGDSGLVQIVLTNLLDNAWKYSSPREAAEIEVGAAQSRPSETTVFVRDNGVGFDMDFAPQLFGLCQRLHSEKEFPGNGLGLAIVRRVVERHGGRVWVDAELGSGATFHFAMPAPSPSRPGLSRP